MASYQVPSPNNHKTYNPNCGTSDGLNCCLCQTINQPLKKCMHLSRRVEPMIWALQDKPMTEQTKCPLFTKLPIELREMIYDYALTDCVCTAYDKDYPIRRDANAELPKSDIAFNLLATCKAVYAEAWEYPYACNPFLPYDIGTAPLTDKSVPRRPRLAPWQFALFRRVDVSLMQFQLEKDGLGTWMTRHWGPKYRHEGALVVPAWFEAEGCQNDDPYNGISWAERRSDLWYTVYKSGNFNFGFLKDDEDVEDGYARDGDFFDVSKILGRAGLFPVQWYSRRLLKGVRGMRARPVTHATIRLSRTDWWTWTDEPGDGVGGNGLALDPALGADFSEDISTERMLEYAEFRRGGKWPGWRECVRNDNGLNEIKYVPFPPGEYTLGWGGVVAEMSDLQCLELVLETFASKKGQLETVIECAKLWVFPLTGTQWMLVWDGMVEEEYVLGKGGEEEEEKKTEEPECEETTTVEEETPLQETPAESSTSTPINTLWTYRDPPPFYPDSDDISSTTSSTPIDAPNLEPKRPSFPSPLPQNPESRIPTSHSHALESLRFLFAEPASETEIPSLQEEQEEQLSFSDIEQNEQEEEEEEEQPYGSFSSDTEEDVDSASWYEVETDVVVSIVRFKRVKRGAVMWEGMEDKEIVEE